MPDLMYEMCLVRLLDQSAASCAAYIRLLCHTVPEKILPVPI